MSLDEIVEQLRLERLTPALQSCECRMVETVHTTDSLSEVISQAEHGCILITAKTDIRILAAAVLRRAAAVVFTSGARPDLRTIDEVAGTGIPLYSSNDTLFTLAGRMYGMGFRGCHG